MKIKIKFEKMHFCLLALVIAISFGVDVAASGYTAGTDISHTTLYTDLITEKAASGTLTGKVAIADNFSITGTVGIGIAPDGNIKLRIKSSDANFSAIILEDNLPAIALNNSNTKGEWVISANSSKLRISSNNQASNFTNRIIIDKNGSMGIGTENPKERLTLEGVNFLQNANSLNINIIGQHSNPGVGAQKVYISGKYAYIAAAGSGLQILDISNPAAPVFVGSYNTPDSAYGIYVSGRYAYIAGASFGLQILDISNPAAPVFVGSYDTPGSAEGIYLSGKYAHVADGTSGLQILDISNPAAPVFVGSYDTPGSAEGIYLSGKYAYMVDGTSGLQILDISNPAAPVFVGNYTTPDNSFGVYVSGKYAYAADGMSGLQIIDISNPSAPVFVGSYSSGLGFASDVQVSGKYAYVADLWYGLRIVDISNPAAPVLAGDYAVTDSAYGIYVSGKYAYLACFDYDLQIFDISGIDAPAASIGSISSSTLDVSENAQIGNNLYVRTGLNVGSGGIKSDGVIYADTLESLNMTSLKPTDLPGTCNPASNLEGAIYYDNSMGKICYCDGAGSWKQIDNHAIIC